MTIDNGNAMHYFGDMKANQASSTLTDRYQTTVPEAVRQTLNLQKRDRLAYTILESGDVLLSRVESRSDPAVGSFLQFLETQIIENPGRLQPITRSYLQQLDELLGDHDVDLDEALSTDGE